MQAVVSPSRLGPAAPGPGAVQPAPWIGRGLGGAARMAAPLACTPALRAVGADQPQGCSCPTRAREEAPLAAAAVVATRLQPRQRPLALPVARRHAPRLRLISNQAPQSTLERPVRCWRTSDCSGPSACDLRVRSFVADQEAARPLQAAETPWSVAEAERGNLTRGRGRRGGAAGAHARAASRGKTKSPGSPGRGV